LRESTRAPSYSESELPGLKSEWDQRATGMRFHKPLREMILTTHLHVMAISLIYLAITLILLYSTRPGILHIVLPSTAFLGLLLDYGCMWLTRYFWHGFSTWVVLFGAVHMVSFYLMSGLSIYGLLKVKN